MTATVTAREPSGDAGQRDRFGATLRAEWTKFRTVRGWVIAMIVAALLMVAFGELLAGGIGIGCMSRGGKPLTGVACLPKIPLGPGGEPVDDSYYLLGRPVQGDGSITVRVASLTGMLPPTGGPVHVGAAGRSGVDAWAKAGLIITTSTRQGSAYAAIMVTGQHGVRLQDDYTHDIAGPASAVTLASPRWLRLTRSGDTVTGSASADGAHWTTVGTVQVAGLTATARAGLFVTSPDYQQVVSQSIGSSHVAGGPSVATAAFDHLGASQDWSSGPLTGQYIGASGGAQAQLRQRPGFTQGGGRYTVTGTGDIAPIVPSAGSYPTVTLEQSLAGAFFALIAIAVVASMFMTAEYRRGLIKITFAATPRRGRVLAAKATVLAAVSFAVGLVASVICVIIGPARLRSEGAYVFPDSMLTEIRIVAGTAALLAVVAVLALAIGTLARRGVVAITVIVAGVVLPYLLAFAQVLPAGAAQWLLRITPAAGFAIQQSVPAYPQVAANYVPSGGYYPLSPWAGFGVLCGFAALAMALALYALRRRDA